VAQLLSVRRQHSVLDVIAPLSKFVDWLFIQAHFLRIPPIDERAIQLEEAIRFLNDPDFVPAESLPAQVEFDASGSNFHFPTPRPSAFAENNVAHGRLFGCTDRWREYPAVILLHGGNLMRGGHEPINYRFKQPATARRCNAAGLNAVTLELPFHFQRYPRRPGAVSNLDYLRQAEAAAQGVAEIRAVVGWLLQEGCPGVALWGTSMGARLAGLTLCHESRLAAVVMAAPGVRSNRSFAEVICWPRARKIVQQLDGFGERLDLTPLNLTRNLPAIPRENILLIEATHDLFTPKEPIEELWHCWGKPHIWRFPLGHVTKSLVPGLTPRVLSWLTPKMGRANVPRL
jgi:dienelactone hydrolase